MTTNTKKRFHILGISILALFVTIWLELFLQRKQHLIGAGINRPFFFVLINFHVIIIVALLYLIIRQSIKLFVELQRKTPASSFKKNLFAAFTIFSVIPSFFVFFIAGKLITTSIDDWFHARIQTGLNNSLILHEKQTENLHVSLKQEGKDLVDQLNKTQLLNILKDPPNQKIEKTNQIISQIIQNNPNLQKYQLYLWLNDGKELFGSLSDEVNIWRSFRKLNDRSMKSLKNKFLNLINDTEKNEHSFDFYGSLYSVNRIPIENSILDAPQNLHVILVHRYDENIRYPLIEIQNSIDDYEQLKSMRNPIYWSYLLTFILVTLLILFLSIWCAFYLAKGISKPILDLLNATDQVRKGDWNVKVDYDPNSDLKNLIIGFNEMTKTLQHAHNQLEQKNKEMRIVLENIKEAFFFVNKFGKILTYNTASKELVEKFLNITRFKNKKVIFFGPLVTKTFFELIRELIKSKKRQLSKETTFSLDSEFKTLLVHLTYFNDPLTQGNLNNENENGLLVIIEDLTDIVKINQIKTWQQAAKQMAHEIKNPLSPIQIATQRLQRKFREVLNEDKIFLECTNTILEHVTIIKDLVSHFSEFAQMPSGKTEPLDLNEEIKEVAHLYQHSYPEINFEYELQNFIPLIKIDKKKIKRVVINLLDNSTRALNQIIKKSSSEKLTLDEKNKKIIKIKTDFKTVRNQIELIITDNGPGIPTHVKDTLFLPYVSTEKKNMGLGLAIVYEIVTQVGGSIKLLPSNQGATFQILLPV